MCVTPNLWNCRLRKNVFFFFFNTTAKNRILIYVLCTRGVVTRSVNGGTTKLKLLFYNIKWYYYFIILNYIFYNIKSWRIVKLECTLKYATGNDCTPVDYHANRTDRPIVDQIILLGSGGFSMEFIRCRRIERIGKKSDNNVGFSTSEQPRPTNIVADKLRSVPLCFSIRHFSVSRRSGISNTS